MAEAPPRANSAKKRSWAFKIQLFATILWLPSPLYFYGRLLDSDTYRRSLELAKSSKEVRRVLGNDIRVQLPLGSMGRQYGEDFAEWSVKLNGSEGSGDLYGVANKVGAAWQFSRLTFVPETDGVPINLTPPPARLDIRPVGPKKIYLVPLSLAPEQSLDWAPAYYKAKLGAAVEILPPVALTSLEEDEKRHQYVAERCIKLIMQAYRDVADDPGSIIIGVTSRDIYIAAFNWGYAENLREAGRLAVVSAARLQPTSYPGIWNKELLNSRLQKILTKNIAILYANLPLSNDYTSLLSSGVLSGKQVDYMSEEIVGAENRWDPSPYRGEPMVSIASVPPKSPVWMIHDGTYTPPSPRVENFTVDLALGLFTQRQIDFYLDGKYPLVFARTYRNADDRSRAFGVGANDSLDIFLVGQMGSFIDLVMEDGSRIHFVHAEPKGGEPSELYRAPESSRFVDAVYEGDTWHLRTRDGWTYFFPYRPNAYESQVTVLTGFADPNSHKYEMVRNDSGDLLSVTTPAGEWLHFQHDDKHHIRRIDDSKGRTTQYQYNSSGQLVRVTDSKGQKISYTYNDRNEMLSVANATKKHPLLTNRYTSNNLIMSQTLADGRHFEYWYKFGSRMVITQSLFKDPNGLVTYFDYDDQGGVLQSLPTQPSR